MARNNARRSTLRLLATLGAAAVGGALPAVLRAQAPALRIRQDIDYRIIAPQPVPPPPAIEVVEFFWYGCPYCDQLQPHLAAWFRRKPAEVVLRHVPAVFRESWLHHAKIYYTLEALRELERLHHAVYEAYHGERRSLSGDDEIADWAARQGIDRERWLATFTAPDIERKVARAREQLVRYAVSGTPTLVVDGRYLTSSGMTPGVAAIIPVLDELVSLVRAERAGR